MALNSLIRAARKGNSVLPQFVPDIHSSYRFMVKRVIRAIWRLGQPLRRAVTARLDERLSAHFQSWFARVDQLHTEQQRSAAEMELLADAMVRELVRLQAQIRGLHDAIARQTASQETPAEKRHAA